MKPLIIIDMDEFEKRSYLCAVRSKYGYWVDDLFPTLTQMWNQDIWLFEDISKYL